MKWPGNFSFNKTIAVLAVWHVAPSCWNQKSSTYIKAGYHGTASFTSPRNRIPGIIFEDIRPNDSASKTCTPNRDHLWMQRLFNNLRKTLIGPNATILLINESTKMKMMKNPKEDFFAKNLYLLVCSRAPNRYMYCSWNGLQVSDLVSVVFCNRVKANLFDVTLLYRSSISTCEDEWSHSRALQQCF